MNLPPNTQPEIRRIPRPESEISLLLQGGKLYELKGPNRQPVPITGVEGIKAPKQPAAEEVPVAPVQAA